MISKTLERELSAYNIGQKIRDLRAERGLKLIELGAHSGLSAAMLSKIERGRLVPTLPTLMRIALVFSVGLDYIFADVSTRHAFAISRKGDRIRLPANLDRLAIPYEFESLDYMALEPKLNAFLAHFQHLSEGKVPVHKHDGIEFIYMLQGSLELTWNGEVNQLNAGDAVYFDARLEHGYRRHGKEAATGIVVTLPA